MSNRQKHRTQRQDWHRPGVHLTAVTQYPHLQTPAHSLIDNCLPDATSWSVVWWRCLSDQPSAAASTHQHHFTTCQSTINQSTINQSINQPTNQPTNQHSDAFNALTLFADVQKRCDVADYMSELVSLRHQQHLILHHSNTQCHCACRSERSEARKSQISNTLVGLGIAISTNLQCCVWCTEVSTWQRCVTLLVLAAWCTEVSTWQRCVRLLVFAADTWSI